MNVRDLKKVVAEIPEYQDDWLVVISTDEEGNGFSEFCTVSNDERDDQACSQFFDIGDRELRSYNEDDYDSFEEFNEYVSTNKNLKPCIVLWP